ncbi:hypothetical protein QBC40DRAFT_20253 [Triangularia verruculosa]|uniref:CFEM domain-containing protein n=1 Tax=Triangularia verruculosa TaxID=2587418 RepID=A0AAN6X9R4_9PEZI|nr:hypothetical protein QBC40DRAFT_20253 [Triangularia verruculosa]
MKTLRHAYTLAGLWLLIFVGAAVAAKQVSLEQELLTLPPCALPCVVGAINDSRCGAHDSDCICSSARFDEDASFCVRLHCSPRETLTAKNITYQWCDHPNEGDRTLLPAFSIFLGLAIAAVALRLVARVVTDAWFWWDDLCNFVAIAGCAVYTGLYIEAVHLGMGKDTWFVPFENITKIMQTYFATMLTYTTTRFFIRASIILFYLRVFPALSDSKLRRVIVWTGVFNVVYNIAFFFAALFQCTPVSAFWTAWEGVGNNQCVNLNALAWSAAATGIAFDIWLLALPFPQLLSLNLHWKKKLMGSMMFLCGAAVVIISLIRLKTINATTRAVNPTKDTVDLSLWTGIEIDVGVICPCLPSFRLLLRKVLPKLMRESTRSYELNPISKGDGVTVTTRISAHVESSSNNDIFLRPHKDSNDGRSCESVTGLVDPSDGESTHARQKV